MLFRGCATALITPFTNDEVDYTALRNIIDYQIDNNVDALVVLGTTAEAATLTPNERNGVIDCVMDVVHKRLPVIIGCGANNTKTAIELGKQAKEKGADGILQVTPFYNKCTRQGLVAHYDAISSEVDIPMIIYNVPSRTGVNVLPSTFEELCKLKNVIGIKEASGNMEQIANDIRIANKYHKAVYSGDDALTVATMAMGGMGVISVASNLYPSKVSEMTDSALEENFDDARIIQIELLPLISSLFCEVNPIPIKKAMSIAGLCKEDVRLPLTPMQLSNVNDLLNVMSNIT